MIGKGKKLPKLEGALGDGTTLSLASLHGKWVVVFFYPKDNTPGCTNEAKDFRDLYGEFQARNAEVIGVSRDSVRSHANFASKHELPFPLVSDADGRSDDEGLVTLMTLHNAKGGVTIYNMSVYRPDTSQTIPVQVAAPPSIPSFLSQ